MDSIYIRIAADAIMESLKYVVLEEVKPISTYSINHLQLTCFNQINGRKAVTLPLSKHKITSTCATTQQRNTLALYGVLVSLLERPHLLGEFGWGATQISAINVNTVQNLLLLDKSIDKAFVFDGYNNWKKAKEQFSQHSHSGSEMKSSYKYYDDRLLTMLPHTLTSSFMPLLGPWPLLSPSFPGPTHFLTTRACMGMRLYLL